VAEVVVAAVLGDVKPKKLFADAVFGKKVIFSFNVF